jgi:hypothetical protein
MQWAHAVGADVSFARTVLSFVELRETQQAAASSVMMWLPAANALVENKPYRFPGTILSCRPACERALCM